MCIKGLQFDSTISQIAIIIDMKYVVFKIKIILLYFYGENVVFNIYMITFVKVISNNLIL